jgi:hypothetical protein
MPLQLPLDRVEVALPLVKKGGGWVSGRGNNFHSITSGSCKGLWREIGVAMHVTYALATSTRSSGSCFNFSEERGQLGEWKGQQLPLVIVWKL